MPARAAARRTPPGGSDLERGAVALRPPLRLAQAGPGRAGQVEGLERHEALLAQLVEGEAELDQVGHDARADLVEHGPPAPAVAALAKAPEQLEPLGAPGRPARPWRSSCGPARAYMMKLRPLSLNRNRLSPRAASQALAMGASACASAASACSGSSRSGLAIFGAARRSASAAGRPGRSAPTTTPIVARRKRGASPSSTNCHHSSLA